MDFVGSWWCGRRGSEAVWTQGVGGYGHHGELKADAVGSRQCGTAGK